MMTEFFIPVNRKKMILMTVLYGIIGLIGFLSFYYFGENMKDALGKVGETVFKALSVIVLVIFSVVASSFGKKVKDKSAGLRLTNKGLEDETTSIAVGLVKWKQIEKIELLRSPTSKSILIYVRKPDLFLEQAKNKAVARLLAQNISIYKTPVVINVSILIAESKQLYKTLSEYAQRFGTNIEIK